MPLKEYHLGTEFLSKKGGALDGRITQHKLNRRHIFETFRDRPASVKVNGAGAATGATGDTDLLLMPENQFECHVKGTQTIVSPALTAVGLDIGMDQTDNDGVELTNGITAVSRLAFVVGTDLEFYFRVKVKVGDISGTDDLCVGFRKAEAYQANVDDYDEAAWIGVGQGAAGRFNSETILNNAATTTTNLALTAWADGETHTLEVRISGRAPSFYVDGGKALAAPAFSFDVGEVLVPFLFFLHSSDVADTVEISEWEAGLMSLNGAI